MACVGFPCGKGIVLAARVTLSSALIGAGAGLLLGVLFSRRSKRKYEPKNGLRRS